MIFRGGMRLPFLLRTTTSGVALALTMGAVPSAQAAEHWMSGVRVLSPGGTSAVFAAGAPVSADAGTTVFDITISLDTDPQGDDDASVDDGANDADQRAYEDRIKQLANALYQMTNGKHKLGKVTIYRDSELMNLVDIQWFDDCGTVGPRARISGFGKPGQHIRQCNTWDGFDMSAPEPSGFTMAHEFGHYIYGVFDEYAQEQCDAANIAAGTCFPSIPRGTDTATIPSIMNSQWVAAGFGNGGYAGPAGDFLEFSTPNLAPYTAGNAGSTAHKRVFGESIWTTLTRSAATDPKFDWMATRSHFSDLVAPVGPDFIVRDDIATAQSELDIRWVGTQVAELMIDVSGSMRGSAITNARTAANLLIDQLPEGEAAIGVGSFASSARQLFPITSIPDPDTGVRDGAKVTVNALSASGSTAMYDGLMLALDEVRNFTSVPGQSASGVVYLLSDGGDNASSFTPAQVIAAYQAEGVAIVSLGYGSGAPTSVLTSLANSTGGQFFQSPTTLPEVQSVFVSANAAFSSTMLVTNSVVTADASATTTIPLAVDSSMASLGVNLTYSGVSNSITFRLLTPSGAASQIDPVCTGTSCTFTLDEAALSSIGTGTFEIEMENGTGSAIPVTVLATSRPSDAEFYTVQSGFRNGPTTSYPAPMVLEAAVNKGGVGLTGLAVTARVTGPGYAETLDLLDDGQNDDARADDGIYSVSLPYSANGVYSATVTASNAGGLAQTTEVGTDGIQWPGTGAAPEFVPVAITENFSRAGTTSSSAAGVLGDDHEDDPAGGACTAITDDNTDTVGRIDRAGDVDCFTFVPSSPDEPLSVRATGLSGGMDPVITVYNSTGTTELASFTLADTENSDSGLVAIVAASALDAAGHVITVTHADDAAETGNYAASVGPALTSDSEVTPVVNPSRNGGSFDLLSLFGLALMSLVGFARRRRH